MLPHAIPDRAPHRAAHRRFRRTDRLWGVLVGLVGMGLLIDRQWARAERRGRAG